MKKMKVDIWSDVRCPFCYIGKHRFENALANFAGKENVEVNWHSFELDPDLKTDEKISTMDYFIQNKGITEEQAQQMLQHPMQSAKELNLIFDFEKSVVANSYNAHRLIQMAQSKGLGNEVKELLFKAHFTDGINIDSSEELIKIGKTAGLIEKEVEEMLASDAFSQEVEQDKYQAQLFGIRGVPYFVFNKKYAVSGAQAEETFLGALNKSYEEFFSENNKIEILNQGDSCDVEGNCD